MRGGYGPQTPLFVIAAQLVSVLKRNSGMAAHRMGKVRQSTGARFGAVLGYDPGAAATRSLVAAMWAIPRAPRRRCPDPNRAGDEM